MSGRNYLTSKAQHSYLQFLRSTFTSELSWNVNNTTIYLLICLPKNISCVAISQISYFCNQKWSLAYLKREIYVCGGMGLENPLTRSVEKQTQKRNRCKGGQAVVQISATEPGSEAQLLQNLEADSMERQLPHCSVPFPENWISLVLLFLLHKQAFVCPCFSVSPSQRSQL